MAGSVKCPICNIQGKQSRVYPGGTGGTLMGHQPYYDEAGIYHNHDPNTQVQCFSCSNGHKWQERISLTCSCGWTNGEAVGQQA